MCVGMKKTCPFSCLTRPPREGEREGQDYRFVQREAFEAMVSRHAFLEWADVFGECYGTGLTETRSVLDSGRDLLLDIDVQGARQVREGPIPGVLLMLLPPDYATLEARLRSRGSEAEQPRTRRLAEARQEAQDFRDFDYMIVNDGLEETVATLDAIVRAERHRTSRCVEHAQRIIATFPPSRHGGLGT